MFVAYAAFINPSSYGLTTNMQAALAVISILAIIFTIANLTLYILYMKDNSPFSKLPFASSVNYQ